jgi:type II secretory pathway pseudopilin PulG
MSALFIALIAALVGSGVAWLMGAPDRAQAKKALQAQEKVLEVQQKLLDAQQAAAAAQTKIARLESERDQREFFSQFSPGAIFRCAYPKGNSLTLDANEPFIVESIDYLTGGGANVGSEEVGKSSKSIEIPLSNEYLGKVRELGPWVSSSDKSAEIQFRVHILKDGLRKFHIIRAVIKPDFVKVAGGQVQFLKIVG